MTQYLTASHATCFNLGMATNHNTGSLLHHRYALACGLDFAVVVATTSEVLARFGDRGSATAWMFNDCNPVPTDQGVVLVLDVAAHVAGQAV